MENLKLGSKLLLRFIASIIMSFMIFMSFTAIFSLIGTESIGYDVWVTDADTGEFAKAYTHYFADGEDTKLEEYKSAGHTVEKYEVRSDFAGTPMISCFTLAQIVSLWLFVMFVPFKLYKIGEVDANKVSTGRMKKDTLKGLKIGLVPASLNIVSFAILLLGKLGAMGNESLTIYRFLNYHMYGYLRLIFGQATSIAEISPVGLALASIPTIITLLLCLVIYILGIRRINLYEKTIYESKKVRK